MFRASASAAVTDNAKLLLSYVILCIVPNTEVDFVHKVLYKPVENPVFLH